MKLKQLSKTSLLSFLVGVAIFCSLTPAVFAADTPATTGSSTVVLPNPIVCNDATCLISQVIRYILGAIAILATLMFIWGGVMMLTSGGNPDMVKKAKETLAWAAIGIIVILMSWVIIKYVLVGIAGTTAK